MRHFPNGAAEGLARAVTLLQSGVWEKEVEGLELLASLAQQHSEVKHAIRSDFLFRKNTLLYLP